MNTIMIIVSILILFVFFAFLIFKEGFRGLAQIFFIISIGTVGAVVGRIVNGETFLLKTWAVIIVLFLFSFAMYIFFRRKRK